MDLIEFIKNHDVDYSYNRVDEAFIPEIEKATGVKIGEQLKDYILNYGYLGFEYVELLGVNNSQGIESDMIKRTQFLHKQFDATNGLIAIEDQGDGDYYLIDESDMIYHLMPDGSVSQTELSLVEYVLSRFMNV